MQYLKYIFLFCCLIFIQAGGFAQSELPEMDTVEVPFYQFDGLGESQFFLKMPYASSKIENEGTLKRLSAKISKIQLVYSDFPKGAALHRLNKKRLAALNKIDPSLSLDPSIKWELVRQTDCASQAEASELFHGFVVTYLPGTSRLGGERSAELADVKLLLSGKETAKDSTILRILNRNKDWKEMLIVADMTGSMTPYIAELLLWVKLNAKAKASEVFCVFNDGDNKLTVDKEIGTTGGIYGTDSQELDSIVSVMGLTMEKGWGGDSPENDIEAVLYGIEKYPQFKEVVLIADNFGVPRDMALLSKINVPIRVIVCGTKKKPVEPIYLDLAKQTGGSVHTIEEDLRSLVKLSEGESITIGDGIYEVRKGRFYRIN